MIFIIGRLWPWIVSEFKYRNAKHFWRPVVRPPMTVVVGSHDFPDWEAGGLMGIGDAKAVDELRAHFRSLHLPADFEVTFDAELPRGRTRDGTFLCLGGPDTSHSVDGIIAELWRRAPTTFAWGDSTQHDNTIYDRTSDRRFCPEGAPANVTLDYALIVRMPNPYAQMEAGEWVLMFGGCLGYGTWGAVRFATTNAFAADHRIRGGAVECLVSVEITAGAPQRTTLLEARPLPSTF